MLDPSQIIVLRPVPLNEVPPELEADLEEEEERTNKLIKMMKIRIKGDVLIDMVNGNVGAHFVQSIPKQHVYALSMIILIKMICIFPTPIRQSSEPVTMININPPSTCLSITNGRRAP